MNELKHHGIKGQKWGVRRFKNKNGSLTPAGRKRYDNNSAKDTTKKISDKQKKAIAIGAAVAGTALATYGAYKLNKYIRTTNMAIHKEQTQRIVDRLISKRNSQMATHLSLINRYGASHTDRFAVRDWDRYTKAADDYKRRAEKAAKNDSLMKATRNVLDYRKALKTQKPSVIHPEIAEKNRLNYEWRQFNKYYFDPDPNKRKQWL